MAQPEQKVIPSDEVVATPATPIKSPFASRVPRAPPKPASVKINVEGAFIVNDETAIRNGASEYVHRDSKDIRLPHHTDVVSHIAVDVGCIFTLPSMELTRARLVDRWRSWSTSLENKVR